MKCDDSTLALNGGNDNDGVHHNYSRVNSCTTHSSNILIKEMMVVKHIRLWE